MFTDADVRYLAIVREVLPEGAPEVGPDTDLRAAGLDSMGAVELLMRVEETYGVSIPDDELHAATFATPGSLWHAVSARLGR